MLGRDDRSLDDEDVESGGKRDLVVVANPLRRQAYGFDDIAIVPSRRTRDPQDVDIGWKLGPHLLELPLLGSAMDGVISPETAIKLGELGGLGVLNLEGIFSRYEDADIQLTKIAKADDRQRDQ